MSLTTFSKFYYGFEITEDNNIINFNEGGSELEAELSVGSYTLEDFAIEIENALLAAGALTYVVSVNRSTRVITISAGSNFSLLVSSGTSVAVSAFSLMGFSGADKTGANSYSGAAGAGFSYEPQFILQDHIATENFQKASNSTVNKTASGRVELIKFGDENFLQCNIKYITDRQTDGAVIKYNASGVSNARSFMLWAIKKAPIEYMANIDQPSTYENILLESTPESGDGTGFKLRELYDVGLPGYFETGVLTFRVIVS